jgi:phenylalanyl-tRNA synthetase alpha chain
MSKDGQKPDKESLIRLATESKDALMKASDVKQLEELRVALTGRKGKITSVLKGLSSLPIEQKKKIGMLANALRDEFESLFKARFAELREKEIQEKLSGEKIDVTLPGYPLECGRPHPITSVMSEIIRIFRDLGFSVAEGPDIESDYYNFEALNIPANHPARDMQDTFYVAGTGGKYVLRTHTSPVQIRHMEANKPPVRVIMPGRVYRHEATDASHLSVFHQVEGLAVSNDITFADLKGTLNAFARSFFGPDVQTRFRPSYFPFTEPSAEMDVRCIICDGRGCKVCKTTGWLETAGCGMVNPKVFDAVKYDREEYTGFAFGMGVERLAMLKFCVNDMRLFFENDLKFLKQF